MITEQNGQIIVDELRDLDEMPKGSSFILVDASFKRAIAFINPENKVHILKHFDREFGQAHLGWIPIPIYKPKDVAE